MSNITFRQCHPKNYNKGRNQSIKYIVIHYTANNGDTAKGNANYFATTIMKKKASAHYFVDETGYIYQSVKDEDTACHCGTTGIYYHKECRNANSIGIELCSRKLNGNYYFKDKTIEYAIELTKELMIKYNIDADHVIRHYDVTHKNCPAPFVADIEKWNDFKNRISNNEVVFNEINKSGIGKIVADELNIRQKPSVNSNIIGKHMYGDVVNICAETDNGWYKVEYPNIGVGYLSKIYIDLKIENNQQNNTEYKKSDSIPDKWAETDVKNMIELGILFGDQNGDLKLHSNSTRQDVIVFLYRLWNKLK